MMVEVERVTEAQGATFHQWKGHQSQLPSQYTWQEGDWKMNSREKVQTQTLV